MTTLAIVALLLAAPEQTYEIGYQYQAGLAYEDATERSITLTLTPGGHLVRFAVDTELVLRRTVLELDEQGRAIRERVEVLKAVRHTKEAPDREPGSDLQPIHGKDLVWKRTARNRWALFEGEDDVTKEYALLAERLKNWRDARLPGKPVAVGESWETSARRFLETVGQPVPEKVEGRAVFTLESVEGGVATIRFEFRMSYDDRGRHMAGTQKGVWRFDVEKGRDLELEMKGLLDVDQGRSGDAIVKMKRTLTYAGDPPAPSAPDSPPTNARKPGSR